MHIIEIKLNAIEKYDVLINGHRYRIHSDMDADNAKKRAMDIKRAFARQGEKSIICKE